jgi:hypothetical protein
MAVEPRHPPFEVAGIGTWHREDSAYMHTLLEAYLTDEWEFTSVHQRSHSQGRSRQPILLNVANLLDDQKEANKNKKTETKVGTTTIVRIYQRSERGTHLRERIDFELRAPGPEGAWLPRELGPQQRSRLRNFCRTKFDAVVVKDLGKGTVSQALIAEVARHCGEAEWFVSSKTWAPDWLMSVPPGRLRLLLVPEMAATDAVRRGRVRAWTTPWGDLTQEALRRLNSMLDSRKTAGRTRTRKLISEDAIESRIGSLWSPDAAIIVSFDDLRVHLLARSSSSGGGDADLFCAHFDESLRKDLTIGLPFSSVLLPATVASLFYRDLRGWRLILQEALRFTSSWRRSEAARINDPSVWDSREYRFAVRDREKAIEGVKMGDDAVRATALKHWEASMSGTQLGLLNIYRKSDPSVMSELQLWRATSDLDDYVCCSERKRTVIHSLLRGIREFKNRGGRYHQGCVLIAPPGSGKSFLIKCLARRAEIRMLEPFNMTQISTHAEIYGHIFDRVHEEQQRAQDEQLLVFVDEINAGHGEQSAYDAFLEPLQDGTYVSNGRRLNLAPCYWIFVDTKVPPAEKAKKWSDFKSRLQDGVHFLAVDEARIVEAIPQKPVDADELSDELDALKLENVYLGTRVLRATNPWVTHATQGALKALYDLRVVSGALPSEGRLGIDNRTLIAHLRGIPIAGTTLRRRHLMDDWLMDWSDSEWTTEDQELVRIQAVRGGVP